MPILKWQTEQAERRSDRGQQISHGEGRALQHTLGGEPLHPIQNSAGEGHEPAGRYNGYAPQQEPTPPKDLKPLVGPRASDREKHCRANNDTCMGWATSTGYCRPHSVQAVQ